MSTFRALMLLAAGLSFFTLAGRAETLRLVAWSMDAGAGWLENPGAAQSLSNSIARNAAVLRELNPDIVILHNVRDWNACQQLAASLEPAKYSVHVCSAFAGGGRTQRSPRQVAILSKQKAYFFWSEAWENATATGAGGFAFAAIQAGARRLGVFVLEVDPGSDWGPASPEPLQWAKSVGSFIRWTTNKLEAAVVAFQASRTDNPAMVEAGLARTFVKTLTLPSGRVNSFSAALPADPNTLPLLLFGQAPLLCDLDIGPENVLQAQARRVDPSLTLLQPRSFPNPRVVAWFAAITAGFLLAALASTVRVLRRRARRLAAPPAVALLGRGDSGTVVVASKSATGTSISDGVSFDTQPLLPVVTVESERGTCTQSQPLVHVAAASENRREPLPEFVKAGVIANLTQWLKQTFVRRILADRQHLLAGQAQAGGKAAAMDARLAGIEFQIQQQTQAYEERIRELTRELNVSREENRALILAKIAQVKIEMQAARAKVARSEP